MHMSCERFRDKRQARVVAVSGEAGSNELASGRASDPSGAE